ncbi:MAG TPA: isoprenylcysteine carboxylmethyltransferase family protein [Ignavibacteriaceae bacterium]|nr:isoprenylcysteine carboxylmethyltransferase family protein [Ignavibacteriaceae bacterium]
MKITGVAPKIAIPTFIYMIVMIIIDNQTKPQFTITINHYNILMIIAIILILIGVAMVFSVAKILLKEFPEGRLMSDGLFKIFRNPMYASYMLFVIPGICLLFNSWLVLTTVIINFIFFKIFIKEEHKYLEGKFGDEYKTYLEKVKIKFL